MSRLPLVSTSMPLVSNPQRVSRTFEDAVWRILPKTIGDLGVDMVFREGHCPKARCNCVPLCMFNLASLIVDSFGSKGLFVKFVAQILVIWIGLRYNSVSHLFPPFGGLSGSSLGKG